MSIQQFKQNYQLSPILLVGGIASGLAGNTMSVLTLTEGSDTVRHAEDSDYFAHFRPMSGGTLVDFTPSEYPFASMAMAANSMVQNALKISLQMTCPARDGANSYPSILTTITRIRQQLTAHILAGGTFTVATPATIYENCLLIALRDVSGAGDKKVQGAFQWDFVQPLVTQQAAAQVYNNLYSKLAGGLPVGNPPTNSGVGTSIGGNSTSPSIN